MKFLGKNYPWLNVGIFAAAVMLAAYYLGSRTGKGKSVSADSEALAAEMAQSPLTYETSQYDSYADKLYVAMHDISDDEETIYSVFNKMRNKSDVLKLILAYGEKRIPLTIGNSTLPQWISAKLNPKEIAKINDILQRNLIQYEF